MNDCLIHNRQVVTSDVIHLVTTRGNIGPFSSVVLAVQFDSLKKEFEEFLL
jgi:hypothetical protein